MVRSFSAKVSIRPEYKGLLLGGVVSTESSRFETFQQAVQWSDQTIEANKEAGRQAMHDGIKAHEKEPEILANGELNPKFLPPTCPNCRATSWCVAEGWGTAYEDENSCGICGKVVEPENTVKQHA